LFGYKNEKTTKLHIIGFFNRRILNQRKFEQKMKSVKWYGGTSFIVIGRTYDPKIMEKTIKPKSKDSLESSPG
jgi:hypothetical protein